MTVSARPNRRQFAALAAAFGTTLAFGPGEALAAPWRERRAAYPHGVASGDPDTNSVILWTRREPEAGASAYRLAVEVAADPAFRRIVARGTTRVDATTDWTCRFLAAGLRPSSEYYYRFTDESGAGSRVGRTLTAPAEDDGRPFTFAFVSCQDVTQGYCNAYKRMIFEDERAAPADRLAFVLHLGDFIYEVTWYPEDSPNGRKGTRQLQGNLRYPTGEKLHDYHVPADLADYRVAYKSYLLDPDLQDARARFPFVCVWDNHEFSWQGFQSQQVWDGAVRPEQTRKIAANQAWFEFQPSRVRQMDGGVHYDHFRAPTVQNAAIEHYDGLGTGMEPNNLAAIRSLQIYRTLKWGRNADLIITDNRSFQAAQPDGGGPFAVAGIPFVYPQTVNEIFDGGRDYNDGHPPATIANAAGENLPNPAREYPRQSYLGAEQKAWFMGELRGSRKPWKLWGHSFGTLTLRIDAQNLPAPLRGSWPNDYGLVNGGYDIEHGEIADMMKREGITGLAIFAGDKHSFWAGTFQKGLPPKPFEPVGVEFITGSISQVGLAESVEGMRREHPLRALYVHDGPNGPDGHKFNMTMLHGVRTSLTFKETGDRAAALAVRNPDVAPHLSFADWGGHGYATVRVTGAELTTEFVCIPRPTTRAATPDGGPLVYRVRHRVPLWQAGQPPRMTQEVVEGAAPFSTT